MHLGREFMNTIILSSKLPPHSGVGGRPARLGSYEFTNDGVGGIFIGYETDPIRKVIINSKSLEECLEGVNNSSYKIKIGVEKTKHFSWPKFYLKKFATKLIPEKIKQEIIQQDSY